MNAAKNKKTILFPSFIFGIFLLGSCQGQNGTVFSSKESASTSSSEALASSASSSNSSLSPSPTHKRIDTRALAYTSHRSDDSSTVSYSSLYRAIRHCVTDFDENSFVTLAKETDLSRKLFSRAGYLGEDDVFYGYENAVQLDSKDVWRPTYFSDPTLVGDLDVIHYNVKDGLSSFHSSCAFANVNTTAYPSRIGKVNLWDTNHNLDSYISVMPPQYSGITKQTYSLKLTSSRIAPSFEGSDPTRAFLGFTTADTNYLANQGLVCNTSTGDWSYYSGLSRQPLVDLTVSNDILFTSTWNEKGGYFVPNQDVTLTEQTLAKSDDSGMTYYVNELTITLADGRSIVKDFTYPALTMAGSISFVAGLDILDEDGSSVQSTCPDFMNGSYFTNLEISQATGIVLPSMRNNSYGQVMTLAKGDYDLVAADGQNKATFQTVLINSNADSYAYANGKDTYSFSYGTSPSEETYSGRIQNVNVLIAALPKNAADVTASHTAVIYKAKKAYEALAIQGERNLVQDYSRLQADYEALESL